MEHRNEQAKLSRPTRSAAGRGREGKRCQSSSGVRRSQESRVEVALALSGSSLRSPAELARTAACGDQGEGSESLCSRRCWPSDYIGALEMQVCSMAKLTKALPPWHSRRRRRRRRQCCHLQFQARKGLVYVSVHLFFRVLLC
ncbi:hypothetical protein DAI22_02g334400 [Oryza sativa Japonica Group]|nr:hypothetical protein DAI22_02g334400 [Oryza sativa Japonica Group]